MNEQQTVCSECSVYICQLYLTHKTSITPPLCYWSACTKQGSERSCILSVSILPLSTIFLLDFGTVPTVCYFGTVPTVCYFGTESVVFFVLHFIHYLSILTSEIREASTCSAVITHVYTRQLPGGLTSIGASC